jgi:hypothetical protein
MQQLTPAGDMAIRELAQRYGVSFDAVSTLLYAVAAGGGTMAQFYHSELGGGGQWMRGGMTMVGDMFNSGLQSRVSGLCSELSTLLGATQVFTPSPASGNGFGSGSNSGSNNWWPAELGSPSSSGGQNNSRYAYFPGPRRLAVETGGQLAVYDTLDHQIGGVQQQQGGPWGSLSFSSQFGTFTVESLPRLNGAPTAQSDSPNRSLDVPPAQPEYRSQPEYQPQPASQPQPEYQPQPAYQPQPVTQGYAANGQDSNPQSSGDVLSAIERLGQLFNQGVLTSDEFQRKKAELLSRL